MSEYLKALSKIKEGADTNTTVVLFHDEARAILEKMTAAGIKIPTFSPSSPEAKPADAQSALPVRRKRSRA